ncbi:hypothetical protein LPTSP4_17360 [Leptospira ryugenii]|uniref:PF04305 family protein n=1 Tax=Leptospira ryugenii TaxID=1917863 RepID=A0A2P2E011_9LEPT|nr:DUF455 family protein [Leptospira ryugenii]GBF50212.1 hypothetical protein LPTSP4_17360 [Leptospira ryugenii]
MKFISDYAKHLLLSTSLEDKLLPVPPDLFSDENQVSLRITSPGRPSHLQFSKKKSKIPRIEHLNQLSQRGLALHHFANHELMAIELFSWALLAFPNISHKTKLGILRTIEEEQTHLKLYLDRMNDFGVTFGDIPLNYLFWKQTDRMHSIEEFSAIMSLSFEGANLDFSQIYAQAFLQHGDEKTAKIMVQVFEDEIKHVKRGVQILKTSESFQTDAWAYYQSLISFPFTPRRAKGFVYFPETRKMAGLPLSFIEALGEYQDEYTGKINWNGLGKINIENRVLRKSDLLSQSYV